MSGQTKALKHTHTCKLNSASLERKPAACAVPLFRFRPVTGGNIIFCAVCRCVRYPQSIASFCTMLRDPADPCCMTPDCSATPTPQPFSTPQSGSTLTPPLGNLSTVAPPRANTPFPTLHPTRVPGLRKCLVLT